MVDNKDISKSIGKSAPVKNKTKKNTTKVKTKPPKTTDKKDPTKKKDLTKKKDPPKKSNNAKSKKDPPKKKPPKSKKESAKKTRSTTKGTGKITIETVSSVDPIEKEVKRRLKMERIINEMKYGNSYITPAKDWASMAEEGGGEPSIRNGWKGIS
tara:strand:+ start:352 stop:816 length:465 start_codon:yes stop_codon:yes gene_type:complete